MITGIPTFSEWYAENNHLSLKKIEDEFDCSAIPYRRRNLDSLIYEVPNSIDIDYGARKPYSIARSHLTQRNGTKAISTTQTYLPAILVNIRERLGVEIDTIWTTDKMHEVQIESINKKLNQNEMFAIVFHIL